MPTIVDVLRDPHLLESGVAQRLPFEAGQTIIVEGAEDRCVYLIERGSVRVSGRVEIEDHRHIQPGLCDLGAGEVFGELSLFESAPRSASVIAVEPCELLVFDAEALSRYFETHPERGYVVLKDLFGVLNRRLRQADRRVGSLFAWGLKAHGIDRHL
ncbi:MAG: cyclic nucleotide-binding domain-containing protein [Chromatiaceae bacterium]|nr:cyclic nucleotide-binding domain-containing protein [Gammaproteobacteria bacterium]MCP5312351.1 cyclic nucleotide-binding domain-containing protein [Chromatiaceae bacterium]